VAVSCWLYSADWVAPLTDDVAMARDAKLVITKLAVVATPVALAVTVYVPARLLAVKMGEVAWPLTPVMLVAMADPLKVPLGPDDGAVNVTVTPGTGLLPESRTMTTSGFAKFLLTGVLCGLPPNAEMPPGAPAAIVKFWLLAPVRPVEVAVSV
jgi:hypothetical protein